MVERPYSRYTRAKTWAALYSQHLSAGYALVPYSLTNNSLDVISCRDPKNPEQDVTKDTRAMSDALFAHAEDCARYYGARQTPEQAPAILAEAIESRRLRSAVVLARSSDYYHYHLSDYTQFRLVICGLHDSYLQLAVWETRSNTRYGPRQTSVAIASPEFVHLRCTQFGHHILLGALINGDKEAQVLKEQLPPRTQRRIDHEVDDLQHRRYQGRPLAFLTEAERREIGQKISQGLKRYHAQQRWKIL